MNRTITNDSGLHGDFPEFSDTDCDSNSDLEPQFILENVQVTF